MCASIIIDGEEYDQIDGHCTCASTWPRIMEFIGFHTRQLRIGEKLVIFRDPGDYIVSIEQDLGAIGAKP